MSVDKSKTKNVTVNLLPAHRRMIIEAIKGRGPIQIALDESSYMSIGKDSITVRIGFD